MRKPSKRQIHSLQARRNKLWKQKGVAMTRIEKRIAVIEKARDKANAKFDARIRPHDRKLLAVSKKFEIKLSKLDAKIDQLHRRLHGS